MIEKKEKQNNLAEDKYKLHQKYAMKNLLERQFAFIEKYIPFPSNILEVGCGVGDFLLYCRSREKKDIKGIDISEESVKITNARLKKSGFHEAAQVQDIYKLADLVDMRNKFDVVIMRGVVHHLEDPKLAFDNIFKVLNSEGYLIILEGNINSGYRNFILKIADCLRVKHEASEFPHMSLKDTQKILKEVGFKKFVTKFLPGVFSPLAYLGFGGEYLWKMFNFLEEKIIYRLNPSFFSWWYFLLACKINSNG